MWLRGFPEIIYMSVLLLFRISEVNKNVSHPNMNGQNTNVGCDDDLRFSVFIDTHCVARTFTIFLISRYNVAIVAARHAREQFHIHFGRLIIECDETARATAEGNLIFSIVPETLDARVANNISECNHIAYSGPAMFAHPTIFTLTIRINCRRDSIAVIVSWWPCRLSNTFLESCEIIEI